MESAILFNNVKKYGKAQSIMDIVLGNRHSNQGSNPGQGCLHFTWG